MRALFFACSFLASSVMAPVLPAGGNAPLPLADAIFRASHARVQMAFLTLWGTLPAAGVVPSQDSGLAERIGRALGIAGPVHLIVRPTYARATAGTTLTHLVVETLTLGPHASETVYSVDRTLASMPTESDLGALATPLTILGLTPETSVNLVGSLPGSMWEKRLGLLRHMLAGRAVREAAGVTTGPYVSVTADAPGGGPATLVAGRAVNVQVALTYDTSAGSTEVTVGSPLISITY